MTTENIMIEVPEDDGTNDTVCHMAIRKGEHVVYAAFRFTDLEANNSHVDWTKMLGERIAFKVKEHIEKTKAKD